MVYVKIIPLAQYLEHTIKRCRIEIRTRLRFSSGSIVLYALAKSRSADRDRVWSRATATVDNAQLY